MRPHPTIEQRSQVLDLSYQLDRNRHEPDHWVYRLRSQQSGASFTIRDQTLTNATTSEVERRDSAVANNVVNDGTLHRTAF